MPLQPRYLPGTLKPPVLVRYGLDSLLEVCPIEAATSAERAKLSVETAKWLAEARGMHDEQQRILRHLELRDINAAEEAASTC